MSSLVIRAASLARLRATLAQRCASAVSPPLSQLCARTGSVGISCHMLSTSAALLVATGTQPPSPLQTTADACTTGIVGAVPPPLSCTTDSAPKAKAPVSTVNAYMQLSKFRLSSLVVMTSGAGFLMAGAPSSFTALAAATIGTSLAAASAAAFNQLYEIKTDALMKRTALRPLPTGRITPLAASAFGSATLLASAATLGLGANELTMALGVGNVALYALIYTPLKQHTTLNTAIGALVGAIPPLMGWAAATGGLLAYEPVLLGLALFWWQFPHFYSLSWTLRKDYARGGYAMVPVTDVTGGKETAWLSLRSALALSTLPIAATVLGVTSPMFAVEGMLLNAYFLRLAYKFYRNPNDSTARAVFLSSLWYLPVLLFFMVFHSKHWNSQTQENEETLVEAMEQGAPLLLQDGEASGTVRSQTQQPKDKNAQSVQALLEQGMAHLHALGRSYCVHELLVKDRVAEVSSAFSRVIQEMCSLGGATSVAANGLAPATRKVTSATSSMGTYGSESGDIGVAQAVKEDTRLRCPVVLVEESGKAAAANVCGTVRVVLDSAGDAATSTAATSR